MKEFDLIIIGSGQGAGVLAGGASKAGKRVAVVERREVGGSCVNFGCTPTKAVLASARLAAMARRATEFGLAPMEVCVDFAAVIREARKLVEHSRASLEKELGDRLIRGHGRIVSRDGGGFVAEVGKERYRAVSVVLNTGTRSRMPEIEGLEQVECIHAGNWLEFDELPKRLAIVGGGYIAVEMGQFYQRMGSQVTIIDKGPQPLANEDEDVSMAVCKCLEREGIQFLLNTRFQRVERAANGWRLTCACPDGDREVEADSIFIATGRKPNTDDVGLEEVGARVDPKSGFVLVDERLQTNVAGLFAIGDIRGGPMFTSTAWDDGRIVLDQICGKGERTTKRVVPYAVYTQPEVGRVGLSEKTAREAGKSFRICRFDLAGNAHAQEERATDGFAKLLVEDKRNWIPDMNRILGAAIVADEAAEMIHVVAALMEADAPVRVLEQMVFVHPTFGEAIQSAVLSGKE